MITYINCSLNDGHLINGVYLMPYPVEENDEIMNAYLNCDINVHFNNRFIYNHDEYIKNIVKRRMSDANTLLKNNMGLSKRGYNTLYGILYLKCLNYNNGIFTVDTDYYNSLMICIKSGGYTNIYVSEKFDGLIDDNEWYSNVLLYFIDKFGKPNTPNVFILKQMEGNLRR